jgi:hypothetical protein
MTEMNQKLISQVIDIALHHKYVDSFDLAEALEKNYIPYGEITNEDISECIKNERFTNLLISHKGYMDSNIYHAKRIATLILLINNKTELDKVFLNVETLSDGKIKIHLEDGHHRLRAHMYTKTKIRTVVIFEC